MYQDIMGYNFQFLCQLLSLTRKLEVTIFLFLIDTYCFPFTEELLLLASIAEAFNLNTENISVFNTSLHFPASYAVLDKNTRLSNETFFYFFNSSCLFK